MRRCRKPWKKRKYNGVWLQREDGGGDGELRSCFPPGGRVRLFVVTTRKTQLPPALDRCLRFILFATLWSTWCLLKSLRVDTGSGGFLLLPMNGSSVRSFERKETHLQLLPPAYKIRIKLKVAAKRGKRRVVLCLLCVCAARCCVVTLWWLTDNDGARHEQRVWERKMQLWSSYSMQLYNRPTHRGNTHKTRYRDTTGERNDHWSKSHTVRHKQST